MMLTGVILISSFGSNLLRMDMVKQLTVMDEKGEAHCACLSESPDFEKWKDEMSPGEIWSVLGEEWVLKVRGQGAR